MNLGLALGFLAPVAVCQHRVLLCARLCVS